MASATGPKGIDWDAERAAYVTGAETLDEVATRLGLNIKSVERMAGSKHPLNAGGTWGEKRAAFRAEAAIRSEQQAGSEVAAALAKVRGKAVEAAGLALDALLQRLRDGGVKRQVAFSDHVTEFMDPIDDKDLVAAARLAIASKLEVGGNPDGVPLQLASSLDALTVDELRRLAGDEAE